MPSNYIIVKEDTEILQVNMSGEVFLVRRMEEGNAEIYLLKDEDFSTVGKDRLKWKYMNQSQKDDGGRSSSTEILDKGQETHKPVRLPLDVQEEIDCLFPRSKILKLLIKSGECTFNSLFLARFKHCPEIDQLFALKHIIPTSHPSRIEGELRCFLEIGGCDNVIGAMCKNKDYVVIVIQYFPHEKFQDCILNMSLLIALRRVHKFNIIHRDVKPSNFLCDSRRLSLCDRKRRLNGIKQLESMYLLAPAGESLICNPHQLSLSMRIMCMKLRTAPLSKLS